jgi:hypothetical protein
MQVDPAGRRGKTGDLSREVLQASKGVVTTNCKKSAEAIVGTSRRAEQFKVKWTLVCKCIGPTRGRSEDVTE